MPSTIDADFFQLLCDSHLRLVGRPLLGADRFPAERTAAWLYDAAPFCVLAHSAEFDPTFIYANRSAQRCFEYSWDEMLAMHSRLSVIPGKDSERELLLETVRRQGYATGYRGLRIAKSGRRFWIEDVTLWNLLDNRGVYRGQAAMFQHWRDQAE